MPIVNIKHLENNTQLGIWEIKETQQDILSLHPTLKTILKKELKYKSASRIKEKLTTYALIYKMLGKEGIKIEHLITGKPIIPNFNISISHTKNFVAVMISKYKNIAVDIQQITNKVDIVADKFIRQDEYISNTTDRLIAWSIKETAYKYFSDKKLRLLDLRIEKPIDKNKDLIEIKNLLTSKNILAKYKLTTQYVLTYSIETYKFWKIVLVIIYLYVILH